MRNIIPAKLEAGRFLNLSTPDMGFTGAFSVMGPCGAEIHIVANDATHPLAQGWEHVSVSCRNRCPNWIEMCFVKDLCWQDEELVLQLHVPKSQHIDNNPNVLHMWRDTRNPSLPRMPPAYAVGYKDISQDEARALGQKWGADQERVIERHKQLLAEDQEIMRRHDQAVADK